MDIRKRAPLIVAAFCLAVIPVVVVKTMGQQESNGDDRSSVEQWEYLAVAGPSTTNFSPTSTPKMRKEPNVPFGREAFVLEQHLDKLGERGWELIAVAGPPTDPAYYFKRRKQAENSR
jgi:hypothetical protein